MASNKEAVKRYQAKRDAIMLRPSAQEGQSIRAAAKSAGESVQWYILAAVRDRMGREQASTDSRQD